MNLTVGKVYAVFSEAGATATLRNGAVLEFPAGQPVTLVAQQATLELDGDAVVREIPNGSAVLLGEMLKRQNGLPAGYTRVEYLEQDGTQYIDTGMIPLPPYHFKFTADVRDFEDTYYCYIFGIMYNTGESDYRCRICVTRGYVLFGSEKITDFQSYGFGKKATYEAYQASPKDTGTVSVDGEICWPINSSITPIWRLPAISSYLFNFNRNGFSTNNYQRQKIYSFESLGGTKQHLIPCLDETGAPCMYDAVNKMSLYNQGSGDFNYPGKEEEPATFSLRRPITYAQLTEHGVRRLYHVPKGYNGTKEEYAAENGFKPLIETPAPEEGYWSPQWRETEEEIVLDWVETEPPTDEFGLPDKTLTNN